MVVAASVKCVVCEKRLAVLYCQQDDAHLCAACDEQVHSANLLASSHQRVPIARAVPEQDDSHFRVPERTSVFEADPAVAENPTKVDVADASHDLGLDDDSIFAVPDIDLPGFATDDVAPKVALGKQLISDDFDFGDLDPLWLDRLDVGIDRLPSDFLDSLVPEAAPPPKPASNPPRSEEAPKSEPTPQAPKQQMRPPPAVLQAPPVHMNPHMMQPYLAGMHWVPCVPAEQQHQPMKLAEVPLDIENYIPHSLLPVDAATHAVLLRSRREKLERFREKKRNRLLKKTIRYASRKAYAEVRPRIKGRFARKDEVAAMRAAGILPAL